MSGRAALELGEEPVAGRDGLARRKVACGGEQRTQALELGMVNHVVPLDELASFTLQLATKIAARPSFGLRLAKESINPSLDAMGQSLALDAALALHNLGHASNLARHGSLVPAEAAHLIRSSSRHP